MSYTEFEWDEAKNRENIRKHGISLDSAVGLFQFNHLVNLDQRIDYGEDRWIAIGWIGPILGVVVYTVSNESPGSVVLRLISARKASRRERQFYEQESGN